MRGLVKIVMALVAVLSAANVHAAEVDRPLQGMSTFGLVVEGLTPGSAACGLTENLIRDSFLYPVSFSRVRIDLNDSAGLPFIYMNVGTINTDNGCVSIVIASVFYFQSTTLSISNKSINAEIRLWNRGGLEIGPTYSHAQQVRVRLEDYSKAFVTEWNLANKPSR
jgi:hypothetical protein